jgi:hypothetical protein
MITTARTQTCVCIKVKIKLDNVCVVCYNKHTAQTRRPRCKVVGGTHKLF